MNKIWSGEHFLLANSGFQEKSFSKNLSLLLQIMLDIAECTDHVRISSVYQILQLCYIDCVSK